ncbi:MAG: hypothetical protein JXB19_11180 [Bacteroidales bacterium]|nr:hypothetical protein [Bacteroidales bacterium]
MINKIIWEQTLTIIFNLHGIGFGGISWTDTLVAGHEQSEDKDHADDETN